MADYRAISTVCEAVVRQLRVAYRPQLFGSQRLEFKVCSTAELNSRGRTFRPGVTLFLYDVRQAAAIRSAPPPRPDGGRQEFPSIQLELRFLLTAWAREANMQQALTGWVLRLMQDHPVLPAALLNQGSSACFEPHEIVEILLDDLGTLELMSIWEKSVRSPYQLSLAFIARNIAITTLQPAPDLDNPGQAA